MIRCLLFSLESKGYTRTINLRMYVRSLSIRAEFYFCLFADVEYYILLDSKIQYLLN